MMGILKDLSAGKDGENFVIEKLLELNYSATLAPPRTLEYDVIVSNPKNFTIEVKNDIYAQKSGNVAIEIWNSRKNKPSGLTATGADLWAHIICGVIYITKVSTLKSFVDKNIPKRSLNQAGDNNASILLYDAELFKTICVAIENINELV